MNLAQRKKINLILALHNHQPEGNFGDVFAKSYEMSYEPFIDVLEKFPQIKVVQHYSGILLRWLQQNRPDFLNRLRRLAAAGQLEMMGGAFYEPILVMIPDEDKVGQIEKLSRFLQENFQVEVTGAWPAERVWEPHLVRSLTEAGIKYTVLDDLHWKKIGFTEAETLHYFVTEEAGRRLFVFPISEKLRYLIPFADPQETIDYLAEMATEAGDRVVVLADDGEKFGSWPGTFKHVYEKQWLEKFFTKLVENSHWLHVTTFQEYYQKFPPAGLVYLPAGAYREMEEWCGSFWRNFFLRYPESNQIHKKMLLVREKITKLPEGPQKTEAKEYLWAGQCNCAYWHGVFGGLYLNFLRSAVYSRLLAAEDLADKALKQTETWLEVEERDFDFDGKNEIIISGSELGLIVAPFQGGSLLELAFKPRRFNLFDVLTRRPETYHCDLYEQAEGVCADEKAQSIHHLKSVKEAGLERLLIYDNYRRTSLRDHFFPPGSSVDNTTIHKLEKGNFVDAPYEAKHTVTENLVTVKLTCRGNVQTGEEKFPVRISKTLTYKPGSGEVSFDYKLQNQAQVELETVFAVEFNLNFLAGEAKDRYYHVPGHTLQNKKLNSYGKVPNLTRFGLVDEWLGISTMFRFDRPTSVWRMPLETVSQSEAGMERVYQGSTLLFAWEVKLKPETPWAVTFTQTVEELVKEMH